MRNSAVIFVFLIVLVIGLVWLYTCRINGADGKNTEQIASVKYVEYDLIVELEGQDKNTAKIRIDNDGILEFIDSSGFKIHKLNAYLSEYPDKNLLMKGPDQAISGLMAILLIMGADDDRIDIQITKKGAQEGGQVVIITSRNNPNYIAELMPEVKEPDTHQKNENSILKVIDIPCPTEDAISNIAPIYYAAQRITGLLVGQEK